MSKDPFAKLKDVKKNDVPKQKVVPLKERKQLLDNYIEKAVKSKISIDNTIERQEKEKSRLEQMKVVKEENQLQKRRPGYRM